ncbi:fibronectin type III domain protein [Roseburia sp. CAG:309]|nr:fibronectin type III domain protein [Roseburia sp. CAG:309]
MRKFFKKMCIGACGLMFVPILAMVPVNAENAPAAQVPMAATGSIEGTPAPSVSPSASPAATATASAAPTATPVVAAFKTLIPDDNFRKAVNELIFGGAVKDNENLTAEMQAKIAEYTGKLDISGKEITNLLGIQYFTGITELDCSHNNIALLDLSKLPNLTNVKADYNDLADVTLAKDGKPETLNLANNNLATLNLAGYTTVKSLDVSNNKLTTLNLAGLYQLTTLDCSDNALSSFGVEGLVGLETLISDGNAVLAMNVSSLKNLKVLENRKSEITLKLQKVSTSDAGVVLPVGASKPIAISDKGTYKQAERAIIWNKATDVPSSFTYTYQITGSKQVVTVTVNVDKTEMVSNVLSLDKVTTLTTKSKAYNKVTLTWSGVDGATGYRVYRSTSKTSGFKKIKSITSSSKVTYTNSNISCGTTYYYKVRAYRLVDGNYYFGAYSPVVSAKAKPATPASFKAGKSTRTKVKVSWKAVTGASGYRIYRSTSRTGGFSRIKTVKSGASTSYVKKTKRNKTYYYKMRAYTTVNGKKVWGAYTTVKAYKLK